jgi:uncharacterized protein YceK
MEISITGVHMKKLLVAIMLTTLITGCGSPIQRNGVVYECYGLIDKDEVKKDGIQYKSETGNVVWSVLLLGTFVVPIWLMGYELYCPVEN